MIVKRFLLQSCRVSHSIVEPGRVHNIEIHKEGSNDYVVVWNVHNQEISAEKWSGVSRCIGVDRKRAEEFPMSSWMWLVGDFNWGF